MPTSRAGTWTSRDGFTLIELAVVVALVALFAGLVLPRLGGFGESELQRAGRRLAKTVEHLYGEAALTGRQHLLLVDIDGNTIEQRRLEPTETGYLEETRVPARGPGGGVRIKNVWMRRSGTLAQGLVRIRAYPVGWIEEAAVYLEDASGAQLTVYIPSLAGTGRVSDGHRPF